MAKKATGPVVTTRVLPCACAHRTQDEMYGAHMRVHNWARHALNKTGGWRCTVCTHERGDA